MKYTQGTVTTGGATRAIVSLSRSAKEITLKDNVESMYASLTIDANTNCVTNADFYFYPAEYAIKPPIGTPAPGAAPATPAPADAGSKDNTAIIVGVIIGAVVLVAIIGFLVHRSRKQHAKTTEMLAPLQAL